MAKSANRPGVNWRQAGGEALLIFLGVGVALFGQAWWEYGDDRDLEQHLLRGFRGDLVLDTTDIGSAMTSARARAAGADELLVLLEDPNAGLIRPTPWLGGPPGARMTPAEWFEQARTEYPAGSMSAQRALYMVVAFAAMQRLDQSDATFGEATASGQLNVILDEGLRALITDYYFNTGRFGSTTDNRVDAHWQSFRHLLAEAGLAANGDAADSQILTVLRMNPGLVAELKNLRDFAVHQLQVHDVVLVSAEAVISRLDQSVEGAPVN